MVRSGLLGLIRSIDSLTFVFDISDVSGVSIGNAVSHNLGAAIGKSHAVFARGSITVTVFIGSVVGTRVVISNSISKVVDSGGIISGFMISGCGVCGFVRCGSWVDNGFVDNWGGFVRSWGRVVDRGGFVVSWGWVIDGSGFVISWGGVIDGGGFVISGGGMIDRGSVIDRCGSLVSSSYMLFFIVVLVYFIRGG
jgi:hypothetical protein